MPASAATATNPALDDAYAALPGEPARLYHALGISPLIIIDADAAGALLASTPEVAGGRLAELAEAKLLGPLPGREGVYELTDLVAAHTGRMVASEANMDRAVIAGRLRDYFLAAATEAHRLLDPWHRPEPPSYAGTPPTKPPFAADAGAALGWLTEQRGNLLAVIRQAAAQEPVVCWQLVDAVWPLWEFRGGTDEWIEAHRRAILSARETGHTAAQARLLLAGAEGLRIGAQVREAADWCRRAKAIAAESGDRRGRAAALRATAALRGEAGELEEALQDYAAALRLAESSGDVRGAALALRGLGEVAAADGALEAADDQIRAAITALISLDDRHQAALTLVALARVHTAAGRTNDALASLADAETDLADLGALRGQAICLMAIASAHRADGDTERARAAVGDALALQVLDRGEADRLGAR